MSEPKQQPKLFLRKPKKSQRPPSDPASKGDGTCGVRSVSTASTNSMPASSEPKRPFWYRFRTALATLLVLNAVVIGYTVFRTSSKPSEISEEAQHVETEKEKDEKKLNEETATERAQHKEESVVERVTEKENEEREPIKAEVENEKAEDVHTKKGLPEPPMVPQMINVQELSKQKISSEEQQELFKWLLAEKRKVKPANKAERAQNDAEKALLKEFLRGKSILNV